MEFHSLPSGFVTSVSERPRTTSLVRLQASRDTRVTNLWHGSLPINNVERRVLSLLDGSRMRTEVVNDLLTKVVAGELSLKRDQQLITDRADRVTQLEWVCDQLLPQFGHKALLAA